jgi:hypothetical protein
MYVNFLCISKPREKLSEASQDLIEGIVVNLVVCRGVLHILISGDFGSVRARGGVTLTSILERGGRPRAIRHRRKGTYLSVLAFVIGASPKSNSLRAPPSLLRHTQLCVWASIVLY